MPKHRNPRQRLTKRPKPSNPKPSSSAKRKPTFDYDGTLDVLRDNLGRADTMITEADELIPQLWGGSNGSLSLTRRRNHVSYLMEAARLAVRAAMYAGDELDLHRRGA